MIGAAAPASRTPSRENARAAFSCMGVDSEGGGGGERRYARGREGKGKTWEREKEEKRREGMAWERGG